MGHRAESKGLRKSFFDEPTLCAMLSALCVLFLLVYRRIENGEIDLLFVILLLGSRVSAGDDAVPAPLTEPVHHLGLPLLFVQNPRLIGANGHAEAASAAEPLDHIGAMAFFLEGLLREDRGRPRCRRVPLGDGILDVVR